MMEKCNVCGASLALVGRSHRCGGNYSSNDRPGAPRDEDLANVANEPVSTAGDVANIPRVANATEANDFMQPKAKDTTYGRYKDKEKRKEYMRQYMLKRRRMGK